MNVTEDTYYKNFMSSKSGLSKDSKKNYRIALTKLSTSADKPLGTIVTECKAQQDRIVEKIIATETDADGNQIIEKQIIKFDVNSPDSKVRQYLDGFISYCRSRHNSNNTTKTHLTLINTFFKYYNIALPDMETFEDDRKKWHLLTKEDFKYVLNDSPLVHACLIKFLQSSGMRIKDALSLTIGDFMEATREYHNFVDVNDFIDNAPSDMIGTWYFHPAKTQKFKVPCLTFNDPETSNLILQHLRKLKNEYREMLKIRYGIDRTISKTDALFGSRNSKYVESLKPSPTAGQFWIKNKKLHEWRVLQIREAIANGELSAEDYDREVAKIPKFHAHACRKYFESTIARNCGNLRICTLMEGHVSPIATDSSYIKQSIEDVKEHYMSALEDLSLENVEAKVFTSEARKQMEEKMAKLEQELEAKDKEAIEMNKRLAMIESKLTELESQPVDRKKILDRLGEKLQ